MFQTVFGQQPCVFLRCLLKCASKAMPSGWDERVILQAAVYLRLLDLWGSLLKGLSLWVLGGGAGGLMQLYFLFVIKHQEEISLGDLNISSTLAAKFWSWGWWWSREESVCVCMCGSVLACIFNRSNVRKGLFMSRRGEEGTEWVRRTQNIRLNVCKEWSTVT